jgi:hypothetical protein
MPRTPKRLAGPAQVTTTPTIKYTTPASTMTIIRNIHISNASGSPAAITISIGADAAGTRIFDSFSVAAAGGATPSSAAVMDYWCFYVLAATETIVAYSPNNNNALVLTVDGDEFTLG